TFTGMFSVEGFIRTSLKKEFAALSKPLSQIMTTELVTCSLNDEVDDVWRLMQEHSFAGLPVVKRGKLIGMVTQKDLLDSGGAFPAFEAKRGRFKAPPKISSIMKTSIISLKPTDTIRKAAEIMLEKTLAASQSLTVKANLSVWLTAKTSQRRFYKFMEFSICRITQLEDPEKVFAEA
ncbi:MAG: CBS domain-containing protein, partial [Candidatus Bathyarchaeia archaeon]